MPVLWPSHIHPTVMLQVLFSLFLQFSDAEKCKFTFESFRQKFINLRYIFILEMHSHCVEDPKRCKMQINQSMESFLIKSFRLNSPPVLVQKRGHVKSLVQKYSPNKRCVVHKKFFI